MKKLYLIGNAHLDPAWLWPWQEGFAEVKATFSSALDRLNEYEGFIFTSSSVQYYEWIEKNEPELFEKIRSRVREGRWVICGGWWIQPDCNIPSGESFVRQGLLGQRYLLEKFGRMATVGYNVDSFGHNGALPQILKKQGLSAYVFLRPGPHEKDLPASTFWWEANDGSRVVGYQIPHTYCSWLPGLEDHIRQCVADLKKENLQSFMCFYGVGNHGGGPTIKSLDYIRSIQSEVAETENVALTFASPEDFLTDLNRDPVSLPVCRDDLQHHAPGCYSANSMIKEANQKAENALLRAEKYGVLAERLGRPVEDVLEEPWKRVLFNQFHDILAGACIESVYPEALAQYGEAVSLAGQTENYALQGISFHIQIPKEEAMQPLVVFNPHPWPVQAVICHERGMEPGCGCKVLDSTGREAPHQLVRTQAQVEGRRNIAFEVTVPPMGYETYRLYMDPALSPAGPVKADDPYMLENDMVRVRFNAATGLIDSIFDKKARTEFLHAPAPVPTVIHDDSDTWSHGIQRFDEVLGAFTLRSINRVETGPLLNRIRVVSTYEDSILTQTFTLYRFSPIVYAEARLNWRGKNQCLKLRIPVQVENATATFGNPFGHIVREATGLEEPFQNWIDISGACPQNGMQQGLTLITDHKYGADVKGQALSLTVLRSPVFAHHIPQQLNPEDEYLYTEQGTQIFQYSLIPHTGGWRNARPAQRASELLQPLTKVAETYHPGEFPQSYSGLALCEPNIILSALKKAHHAEGYILRAYETDGKYTAATIQAPLFSGDIQVSFSPYEVKTLLIRPGLENCVQEVSMTELPPEHNIKEHL